MTSENRKLLLDRVMKRLSQNCDHDALLENYKMIASIAILVLDEYEKSQQNPVQSSG